MDIIFNCPHCEQELAVDSAGAGSEIQCPSCSEKIMIPQESSKSDHGSTPPAAASGAHAGSHTIASSAAAKVEMHLKVPVHDKPAASLIEKPKAPLVVTIKGAEKKIRVRTIRHSNCVDAGHDKFDEMVMEFLNEVGEANLIGVHPVGYTHFDVSIQKILEDYGLVVVYRG